MATPKAIVWKMDPHTLAKHEILRRYLGAWFGIMSKYNPRIIYIDGFCGPGRYDEGEPGSPIIALEEAQKHGARLSNVDLICLFMDERSDRIKHLQNELATYSCPSNFSLYPITGLFDVEFRKILNNLEAKGVQIAPTFAFIDPFGFKGVPFDLIQRLLGNPKTEVFVNVMVDSMNRFLEHHDAKVRQHIVDLFGTSKVLDIAKGKENRIMEMRLLYQQQLKKSAKFVRYFEMRDDCNKTIYYLFFATNHSLGHRKMKEAFWKVDPSSGFRFSDATNPNQLLLFEFDQSPVLAEELFNHFSDRRVSIEEIELFVYDYTAFLDTHMRNALRLLEQENKIKVDSYKQDGTKRRRNTFPKDAVVEFIPTFF